MMRKGLAELMSFEGGLAACRLITGDWLLTSFRECGVRSWVNITLSGWV
jgi:hypothetical protein